jgi:hypothetical protein
MVMLYSSYAAILRHYWIMVLARLCYRLNEYCTYSTIATMLMWK